MVAGISGSNPAGGHGCLSLLRVVCCEVDTIKVNKISQKHNYENSLAKW
jgi:hypothetical protein